MKNLIYIMIRNDDPCALSDDKYEKRIGKKATAKAIKLYKTLQTIREGVIITCESD